ncbi:MAG: hypothetical protein QM790_05240 [Nibricoccus sp.]
MKPRSTISTRKHLEYARGYIELGLVADATTELENIEGEERDSLAVRRVWVDLHMEAKRWKQAVELAEQIAPSSPEDEQIWISWAYALRELHKIKEAQDILLRAEKEHGHKNAILHYNLACYACLLGDLITANKRLKRAIKLDKRFEDEWAKDPDLKAMLDVF